MNGKSDRSPAQPGGGSVPTKTGPCVGIVTAGAPVPAAGDAVPAGRLIINADDWGRDRPSTDRTLECAVRGTVSSVSAMVFMEDSERAAAIAREKGIDAGLHINFTTSFSALRCSSRLIEHQQRLGKHLRRHRLAQILFHPGLTSSFEYVVSVQFDEFLRLYGTMPERLDGHHHLHLCANVLFGKLLPAGTIVRRNFSIRPGEKSIANRSYRKAIDHMLARRHRIVDFLFSLAPLEPADRLEQIFDLARRFVVEVETHPINEQEYRFLKDGEIFRSLGSLRIEPRFSSPEIGRAARGGPQ
jgi:predicted glycoside hydrolase/deacetylase ChbG (UPF0249 family)